jgi:hypothetical protein
MPRTGDYAILNFAVLQRTGGMGACGSHGIDHLPRFGKGAQYARQP